MAKIVVLVVSALLLNGGCSLKQDPLSGQSERLRMAGQLISKPNGQATEDGNLLIDPVMGSFTFTEGVEDHFSVSPRSLLPEFNELDIEVENMDEFQDGKFDSTTGTFTWKPRIGTTGGGTEAHRSLKIRAKATARQGNNVRVITHGKVIDIKIIKIPGVPYVQQVLNFPSTLREGDNEIFHVLVKDLDGGVSEPILEFFAPSDNSVNSVASFVSVEKSAFDPRTNLWTFDCRLRLTGELTNSVMAAGVSIKVLSGFGRSSVAQEESVLVMTSKAPVLSTWISNQKVQPGVATQIPFLIYNQKGEGSILITKSVLPDGAVLNCGKQPSVGSLSCVLTYTPVAKKGRRLESVDLTLELRNIDNRDDEVTTQFMSFAVTVEAL